LPTTLTEDSAMAAAATMVYRQHLGEHHRYCWPSSGQSWSPSAAISFSFAAPGFGEAPTAPRSDQYLRSRVTERLVAN
jgi:hypothetical protein